MGIPKLLHSSRGNTEAYQARSRLPGGRGDRGARAYLIAVTGPESVRLDGNATLELPFHHGEVRSRHDRRNDRYLWYAPTQSGFSARPEDWRILAWLVSPDLSVQEAFALPAGPWV
jgi:hypothetical protein